MNQRLCLGLCCVVLGAAGWAASQDRSGERELDARMHHLGNDKLPEWKEASPEPEGTRLDLRFEASAAPGGAVLALSQRSIDNPWHLSINGVEIGVLRKCKDLTEELYALPGGVLRDGANTLAITPDVPTDDVTVGRVRLIPRPLRDVLGLQTVTVRVRDADGGVPLPARITVADRDGRRVRTYGAESPKTAVREGVVYTLEGEARIELPRGAYRVFATRGAEWSMAEASFELSPETPAVALELALRREVDTKGFIAADTHIHTLTFSGHGDSNPQERIVTLAGEGVELAVATDHNHHTDYRPYQAELGAEKHFTSVTGNEVTTPIGHFNAFPLDPKGDVPPYDLKDVVKIVDGIRAKGAKVVILNHPRWPDPEKMALTEMKFDRLTGEHPAWPALPVDATELINSTVNEPEPLSLFADWFALLDRGEKICAVGSSDSHTVDDVVGQGRTYVKSSTDDPTQIDVDEACTNIRTGVSSIGMGIFADILVDGRFTMSDLVPLKAGRAIHIAVRVAAPAWVTPRRLHVFVDGVAMRELDVPRTDGRPTDARIELDLSWPYAHDAWLVAVVIGDAVAGEFWPSLNPYTLAATNPVFLDGDGDGRYSSPLKTAMMLTHRTGSSESEIQAVLSTCDSAVAIQLLTLAHDAYMDEARAKLQRAGGFAAEVNPRLRTFLDSRRKAR